MSSQYSSLPQYDQQYDEDLEIQATTTTLGQQQQTMTSIIISREKNLDGSTTTRSEVYDDMSVPGPFLQNRSSNQQDDNRHTANHRRARTGVRKHHDNNNGIKFLPTYCIERAEPVTILQNQKLPQSKARFRVYFCVCRCMYLLTLILLMGGILSWFVMSDFPMDIMKKIVVQARR